MEILLNGRAVELEVDPGETLLHALRDRTGTCSVKDGCSPQGQCGCCLALVDGRAITICSLPASRAQGKSVVTLEGIDPSLRSLYGRCFESAAGLQCGFCIPGIMLRAHHLLEKTPEPSPAEIVRALEGHLCRCTGYKKIQDAVALMGRARRGEWSPPEPVSGGVGSSLARYQAVETSQGARAYVDDVQLEGMLYAAMVFSPHPRARVLAIDLSAAEEMPGVVRIATAADVPGERLYGLLVNDWPGLVAVGEEVRCVGDVLAVVAATSRCRARAAAEAVRVEYELLEPVLDPGRALELDSPLVNPYHARGHNLLSHSKIVRGEARAALESSAHVVEGVWETQRIEHLFLEPESAVAIPLPEGRLKLLTQGQGIFDDRRQVASFLGLPEELVEVELLPNGGAFGGKEDMSVQAQAALLAFLTGRPVKLTLSREESVRLHPKRHPIRMEYRVGCDADGRLTAVVARMVGDSGAYASVGAKVLERAAGHACGPYAVPHVEVEALALYTNNPPCGAMRGFGVNQAAFAMEGCLDQLAVRVGLDGWAMRRLNALENGGMITTGQVLSEGVGLVETLEAVRERYYALRAEGWAVGIACGLKNTGIGNGVRETGLCRMAVEEDGTVSVYIGYTEMGQGLLTVAIQFAVEATGLPAGLFRPRVDSTYQLGSGQTTGSRATFFVGKAVLKAGSALKQALASASLQELRGQVFAGEVEVRDTTALYDRSRPPKTHSAFSFATQLCVLDAQGRVTDLIAAHDVGRVVNPLLCEGQLEGSLHMGLGYALSEELPCVDGMPVATRLREIGVLRSVDMPRMEVILLEVPSAEGPMGAKGVGEIGLVPTAAAVASALFAYDGVVRTRLPMKDSPAGKAISVGRIRHPDPSRWR